MLGTFLKGASTGGGLKFVGGVGLTSSATQTPSFSLTGLSGGLASAPAIGDIVVVAVSFTDSTDRNIQCTTSGYTEVADLFRVDVSNATGQLGVYYKVLSAADTSVAFDIGVSVPSYFTCHVWREINATPLDATTTTANGRSPTATNAPPITTTTNKAVVIAVGGGGGSASFPLGTPTAPSEMINFFSAFDVNNGSVAIASRFVPLAGAYDPPAFGGMTDGATANRLGWSAATLALRLK